VIYKKSMAKKTTKQGGSKQSGSPEGKKAVAKTTKKTVKKPAAKRKQKKTKKKKLPISAARIRKLAISSDTDTMTTAEVEAKTQKPLTEILAEFPRLQQAWDRGRMLRNLQQLAATAVTISEAEEAMALEPGKLKELLDTDLEIAGIWNEARLQTILDIKKALVDSAIAGKQIAAKQVEEILRREIAHPRIDFHHLTTQQMVDITGKARKTIHEWTTKQGLPRNSDKTHNLTEFLKWHENFIYKKVDTGGRPSRADLNPYQQAKAKQLQNQIQKDRGQLLDRLQVVTGQVARHQNLVNSFSRKADELAMICHGAEQGKISEILNSFFEEVRQQQCQIPDELRLPPEAAKILMKLLEMIKPEGDE